jgi:hypothetical protein
MRPASHFNGYYSKAFPAPFFKQALGCTASVQSEILGSLDLYAEVKPIGKELLKVRGHATLTESFLQFQAYIRQARTFFEAAESLHHRASPLNYYYAFMNFAKAWILVSNPGFVDDGLVHGLQYKATSGNLRKQTLRVLSNGVFPKFYKETTRVTINNPVRFRIVDLLSYVTDIRYEYGLLKYGKPQSFACKFALCLNHASNMTFGLIAAQRHPSIDLAKTNLNLHKAFDIVSLDQHKARELFDLKGEDLRAFQFFESKSHFPTNDINKIPNYIAAQLSSIISYNPVNDPFLFVLNQRIRSPRLLPMQEMLAIYCCMYFLGSLVRYGPDLLEAMLATRDAWIIERFTKSAPLAFLRHIRNQIDGYYLAYHAR